MKRQIFSLKLDSINMLQIQVFKGVNANTGCKSRTARNDKPWGLVLGNIIPQRCTDILNLGENVLHELKSQDVVLFASDCGKSETSDKD